MLQQTPEECIEVEDQSLCRITHELRKRELVTIDKRGQGGRLWVIGSQELQSTLTPLQKDGLLFGFPPKGSKSTNHLPEWYLVSESLALV